MCAGRVWEPAGQQPNNLLERVDGVLYLGCTCLDEVYGVCSLKGSNARHRLNNLTCTWQTPAGMCHFCFKDKVYHGTRNSVIIECAHKCMRILKNKVSVRSGWIET